MLKENNNEGKKRPKFEISLFKRLASIGEGWSIPREGKGQDARRGSTNQQGLNRMSILEGQMGWLVCRLREQSD